MNGRHVWLVQIGESLPGLTGDERRLRTALLADALVNLGHRVTWWASTFDHYAKRFVAQDEGRVAVREGLDLELLAGTAYGRNISPWRVLNHLQIARRFRVRSEAHAPRPDVIVASYPTVELAAEAVRYARQCGVSVVVDVRDLWPDAIVDLAPPAARPLVRAALRPMFAAARRALGGASALTAPSEGYLTWALARAERPRSAADRVFPLGYPELAVPSEDAAGAGRRLAALGVDPRRKIALFVGMFGRTYDLTTVIEAARRLRAQGRDDVQFVLSGAGDRDARWRAEAAGLDNVVFTGWVARADIAYLLSVAWVGLAAYARGAPQSLPNKPFEYMSAGLPVLSCLGAEAVALLDRHGCGLSYRAGDAADLEAALSVLLRDPARHQAMREASRAAFKASYSADAVYAGMANYVEAMAAGRP